MANYDAPTMCGYEDEAMPVNSERVDMHVLLEQVKSYDQQIGELHQRKDATLKQYYQERDKLDAHHEMVVNRPTMGMTSPSDPLRNAF